MRQSIKKRKESEGSKGIKNLQLYTRYRLTKMGNTGIEPVTPSVSCLYSNQLS